MIDDVFVKDISCDRQGIVDERKDGKRMKMKNVLALVMMLAITITSIPVTVSAQEVSSEEKQTAIAVGRNTSQDMKEYVVGECKISYKLADDKFLTDYDISTENGIIIVGCEGDVKGNLEIPEKIDGYTVVAIDSYAFLNCTSLKSVTLPKTIEFIDEHALDDNDDVHLNVSIYCEENEKIYVYRWAMEMGFTVNEEIEEKEEDLSTKADKFSYKLNEEGTGVIITGYEGKERGDLKIPSEINGYPVTEIGESAFENDRFSGEVTFPSSLVKIGKSAFEDCQLIGELTFPEGLTEIGQRAFCNCGTFSNESLTIPDAITTIEQSAFARCQIAGELKLPSKLESIENWAFDGCEMLSGNLIIPENVSYIGIRAFFGCTKFDKIFVHLLLNEDMYRFGDYAFCMNENNDNVWMPVVFYCCEGTELAEWLTKQGANVVWVSSDKQLGYQYNEAGTGIIITESMVSEGDLRIPEEIAGCPVTEIGDGAFENLDLKNVFLPKSIASIGNSAIRTGAVIHCEEGTYAYQWAKENGFQVEVSSAKTNYRITYVLNGGTNNSANPKSYQSDSKTIKLLEATRKGYKFSGWYSDSNYKTKVTEIATGSTGNKTLYAQWKKTTYKITYKLNSGKNSSKNPSVYTVTTSTIKLKNPTRTGYRFGGWYTSSKYKTKITEIKKGSTGNKTVYAKWTPNKYTIAFKGNGSTSGKMSSMSSRKYGTSYKLTLNTFKKKGYTFVGWNTKANGKGKSYKNKASVKNLTSKNGGKITLYAQWKKK